MQKIIEKMLKGTENEIAKSKAMIKFYEWDSKNGDTKVQGENTLKIQQLEKINEQNTKMAGKLKEFIKTL